MSASQRTKGQRGERELFALLSGELGSVVRRRVDAPGMEVLTAWISTVGRSSARERRDFYSPSGIKPLRKPRMLNGGRCFSGVSLAPRGQRLWTYPIYPQHTSQNLRPMSQRGCRCWRGVN
jgi:hypothetical protein